ncbi:MAG: phosphate ABC transporter permease PstA [Chroococcidiopsidaceae cyanobacterium CP_BM_ER_R8_30]|nr:phosphate ABC transporter permease PstA [Chroococcidiopsidaceae cyanobacterium CP_BM_ER_R8_30]
MTFIPSNQVPQEFSTNGSITAELFSPLPRGRTLFNTGMTVIAFALTALALLPLFAVLISILVKGIPHLKLDVFTSLPAPPGGLTNRPNGFANAIIGTVMMVGIASLLSLPFGIITGIFLAEFGHRSALVSVVRFLTTILTGVPSIIFGVFVYGVIVLNSSPKGFSAVAGGIALALIMLPIVALTTEQALKLVPQHNRLGSAALGASRLQTTFRIVVSAAIPAITTGFLLALARAAGETAPLVFTALLGYSPDWPQGFFNPTPSLAVLIYNYATSPETEQNQIAWTAALVLVGLVLGVSIFSRLVTSKRLKIRG